MEWIKCTDELRLAMNAGARAIENTKRYHGTVYVRDVFSGHPQEIAYLRAATVLREVSNAPAADLSPAEQSSPADGGEPGEGQGVCCATNSSAGCARGRENCI